MKKLTFPTQAEAQAMADKCQTWLVANDVSYDGSVQAGMTTAWAKPEQSGTHNADGSFTPAVPEEWFIWVTPQLVPVDPLIAALFPGGSI